MGERQSADLQAKIDARHQRQKRKLAEAQKRQITVAQRQEGSTSNAAIAAAAVNAPVEVLSKEDLDAQCQEQLDSLQSALLNADAAELADLEAALVKKKEQLCEQIDTKYASDRKKLDDDHADELAQTDDKDACVHRYETDCLASKQQWEMAHEKLILKLDQEEAEQKEQLKSAQVSRKKAQMEALHEKQVLFAKVNAEREQLALMQQKELDYDAVEDEINVEEDEAAVAAEMEATEKALQLQMQAKREAMNRAAEQDAATAEEKRKVMAQYTAEMETLKKKLDNERDSQATSFEEKLARKKANRKEKLARQQKEQWLKQQDRERELNEQLEQNARDSAMQLMVAQGAFMNAVSAASMSMSDETKDRVETKKALLSSKHAVEQLALIEKQRAEKEAAEAEMQEQLSNVEKQMEAIKAEADNAAAAQTATAENSKDL